MDNIRLTSVNFDKRLFVSVTETCILSCNNTTRYTHRGEDPFNVRLLFAQSISGLFFHDVPRTDSFFFLSTQNTKFLRKKNQLLSRFFTVLLLRNFSVFPIGQNSKPFSVYSHTTIWYNSSVVKISRQSRALLCYFFRRVDTIKSL